MPDPSPSTLTVLNSNFSEEGVVAGHSGQFTHMRLPVNTVIHTTLAGLEPTTSRLLVRRATVVPPTHRVYNVHTTYHSPTYLCCQKAKSYPSGMCSSVSVRWPTSANLRLKAVLPTPTTQPDYTTTPHYHTTFLNVV